MPETTAGSSVLEFYNDSNIFITGGTGFLGKVLIEKFLRMCTNTHLYLLIRTKKGKDPDSRLKELFDEPNTLWESEKLTEKTGNTWKQIRTFGLSNLISQLYLYPPCIMNLFFPKTLTIRGLRMEAVALLKRDKKLFKVLRKEKPDYEKNVTCIPGDVNGLRLSMSDSDYEFLTNKITHVFHSAATVRFNEHLKTALGINVFGTQEIVKFCKNCKRLKVLVHISTAFSNCVKNVIDEEFFDPPLLPEKALSLVDTLSEDKLNSLTTELIKPWPNSYAYTKAIAENVIKENAKSIPALIVRPSIVIGSMSDPVEGWVDNIYGPTGIITGVALGIIRIYYANPHSVASIVPVDLTVNAIISCAWDVGSNYERSNTVANLTESPENIGPPKERETLPKIFNFVPDKNNSITWGVLLDKSYVLGADIPSEKAIWYYTVTLTKVKWLYTILTFLLHFLPGYVIDIICVFLGKKPQMIKIYQKIQLFTDALSFFSCQTWEFSSNNTKGVWSRLSDKDKELFFFNMATINWDFSIKSVLIGIRNYILKETDESIPYAQRRTLYLWIGHRLLQFFFAVFCFWILSKFFSLYGNQNNYLMDPALTQIRRNST